MNKLPFTSQMNLFKYDHNTFLLDVPAMRLFKLEGEDVFTVLQVFQQAFDGTNLLSPEVDLIAYCEEVVRNQLGESHGNVQEIFSELSRFRLIRAQPLAAPEPLHESSHAIQTLALVSPLSIPIAQKAVNLLINEKTTRRQRSLIFWGAQQLDNLDTLKTIIDDTRQQASSRNCQLDLIVDLKREELTEAAMNILSQPDVLVRILVDDREAIIDKNQADLLQKLIITKPSQVMARVSLEKEQTNLAACIQTLATDGFKVIEFNQPISYGQVDALSNTSFAQGSSFVSNFIEMAAACHLHLFRTHTCTAGFSFFAIAPSGEIYACPYFISAGLPGMGHVDTGIDMNKSSELLADTVDTHTHCQTCGARYFCGGGCLHKTLTGQDGISLAKEECISFNHWLEAALIWYSQVGLSDKALLDIELAMSSRFHPYRISSLASFRPIS